MDRDLYHSGALTLNQESLRVIQLTDLHLDSPAKPLHHREGTTEDTLRQVIERVRTERKDLVLCTGDLADNPSTATYEILRDLLATLDCPVYCLPGNHDDPALARDVLRGPNLSWDKQFQAGHWRIVQLNSAQPGRVPGTLDDAELAFLDRALAAFPSAPTLVCLHHHPLPTGSPWMDSLMLTNPQALFEIIERHPHVRGMLWGHIHQAFDQTRGALRMLGSPSTCMQFVPQVERFTVADLPPAFRRLDLHADGSIETNIVYCDT